MFSSKILPILNVFSSSLNWWSGPDLEAHAGICYLGGWGRRITWAHKSETAWTKDKMSHQPEALLWSSKSLDSLFPLTFEKSFEGAQEGFRALSQEHKFLLDIRPTADTNWLLGQRLATRSTVSSTVSSRTPLRRTRITRVTASSQELARKHPADFALGELPFRTKRAKYI